MSWVNPLERVDRCRSQCGIIACCQMKSTSRWGKSVFVAERDCIAFRSSYLVPSLTLVNDDFAVVVPVFAWAALDCFALPLDFTDASSSCFPDLIRDLDKLEHIILFRFVSLYFLLLCQLDLHILDTPSRRKSHPSLHTHTPYGQPPL